MEPKKMAAPARTEAESALEQIIRLYESGDPHVIGFVDGYVAGRNSQHAAPVSA